MIKNLLSGSYKQYWIYRKNVMTPLNWFFSSMNLLFFYGVVGPTQTWIKIVSLLLISVLLGSYLYAYFYTLHNDPNRLQSEGARLEEKALDCLSPLQTNDIEIISDKEHGRFEEIQQPINQSDPEL